MERAERDGLCDDANLAIFKLWYAFGGYERGLSLDEIDRMPVTRLKDFLYLSRRTGRILRRKAKQKARER